MTPSLRMIVLPLLLAGMSACGNGSEDPAAVPTPEDVAAADRQNGAPAEVVPANAAGETTLVVGQVLEVSLEGNPSTGYLWEIDAGGAPQLALAPSPVDATPATDAGNVDASPMVGSPVTIQKRFEAVQPGTTTVRLVYRRPWEKDAEPEQAVEFKVVVNEAGSLP